MNVYKNWNELLKKGVLTEEMLCCAIYSVNKRAKNCRDKQREYVDKRRQPYCGYYKYDYIGKYKEKKEEYYALKKMLLTPLHPVEVHEVYRNPNLTEYFLFYKTAFGSFHEPIKKEDIPNVTFGYGKGIGKSVKETEFTPNVKALEGLTTVGADINNLVSVQFVRKVTNLITSGTYKFVPAA